MIMTRSSIGTVLHMMMMMILMIKDEKTQIFLHFEGANVSAIAGHTLM